MKPNLKGKNSMQISAEYRAAREVERAERRRWGLEQYEELILTESESAAIIRTSIRLGASVGETERLLDQARKERLLSANDVTILPQWKCHKVVRAAKITDISYVMAGAIFALNGVHKTWGVDRAWLDKHNPKVGGYLVAYDDGYTSYSPPYAFEDGYERVYPTAGADA